MHATSKTSCCIHVPLMAALPAGGLGGPQAQAEGNGGGSSTPERDGELSGLPVSQMRATDVLMHLQYMSHMVSDACASVLQDCTTRSWGTPVIVHRSWRPSPYQKGECHLGDVTN